MNNNNKPIKINMIWIIVIVILNIIIVAFIFLYIRYWHVPDRSDEAEKILKRVEKRIGELESIPPEENGWTYYYEASECLNFDPIKKACTAPACSIYWISDFMEKKNIPEKLAVIKKCASINKKNTNLVDRGFEKDMIFVPPRFINQTGFEKEYENLMSLGYFLVLLGDYEREMGYNKIAAKRYLESIIIGMKNEEARIPYWMNFIGYAKKQLLNIINDTENSKETYKYIINKIDRIEKSTNSFRERTELGMSFIDKDIDEIRKAKRIDLGVIPEKLFYERERAILQNTTLDFLECSRLKYSDAKKSIKNVKTYQNSQFYSSLFLQLKIEYLNYYIKISSLRGIKLLCALKYYRVENGEYPDSLNDLVPKYINKIPKDPFPRNGKYVYKKKPDGSILLYSVGPNLKDNNGKKPGTDSYRYGNCDIVFTSTK